MYNILGLQNKMSTCFIAQSIFYNICDLLKKVNINVIDSKQTSCKINHKTLHNLFMQQNSIAIVLSRQYFMHSWSWKC